MALVLALALPVPSGVAFGAEPADAPQAGKADAASPPETQKHVIPGPGGKTMEIAAGPGSVLGKDELILKEYVDIKFGDNRLQADFVRYTPSTKEAYAEGNVILDQAQARLTADSLVYNLETETGTFFQARGYAEPSLYFEAKRIEKISKDELILHDATFTACTQPVPYWSFKVGHGLLRLNDYAYLHNFSFKVKQATVFYTPFMIWPIKSDRAAGLLFPEFGFSRRSGTVVSNAIYWPIRRNMDATAYLDYLSHAGMGEGLEYRYVPSANGSGLLTGYYIHDQVQAQEMKPGIPVNRWVLNYAHHQDLESGWRLVANANFISDFNYYLDFVRDLRQASNPQAVSNLFLTRNWGFYSVNIRGERREQLLSIQTPPSLLGDPFLTEEETITRWIQPAVELRGRRQRLGNTPLFLTLEASADSFRKGDVGANYQRLDLFPVFSSQLSPVPWLDVSASAGYRDTYYTKTQVNDLGCDNLPNTRDFGEGNGLQDGEFDVNGNGVFDAADDIGCDRQGIRGQNGAANGIFDQEKTFIKDDPFNRKLYTGGVTIIGPKLSRVFNRPNSTFSPQYKNTIEPTVTYTYTSEVQGIDKVITFDQIDSLAGHTNFFTYGFVTRLFAKRSVGGLEDLLSGAAGGTYVGGGLDPWAQLKTYVQRQKAQQPGGQAGDQAETEKPGHKQLSTVEIATFEIEQDYSFLGPLSESTALNESRPVSPIRATLRINPSLRTSIDLRTSYDILFQQFQGATLSANLRSPRRGFLDFTWSSQRDLEGRALFERGLAGTAPLNRSQIGLQGETNLLGRRVLLGMQTNYELGDIQPGEVRLRDQRYKFGYNTQCCGIQFEFLNRNYVGTRTNEIRFLINLKGVGNVIDLQSQVGGLAP